VTAISGPKRPEVSILLPFHEDALYLGEAIESVLQQSYTNFECLLISNNANDDALKVAARYCKNDTRFMILRADGLNLPQTLNMGIIRCRGEYIARMDSDDIMHAERISRQLLEFYMDSDLLICGSYIDRFGMINDSIKYPNSDLEIKTALLFQSSFASPTIMAKRIVDHKSSETMIHYDENYPICEDYEMFVRYLSSGVYKNIPESLLRYRIHDRQTTFTHSKMISKLSDRTRAKIIRLMGGSFGVAFLHNAKVNGVPMFRHIEFYLINRLAELLYSALEKKYPKRQIEFMVRKNYRELVKPASFNNLCSYIYMTSGM